MKNHPRTVLTNHKFSYRALTFSRSPTRENERSLEKNFGRTDTARESFSSFQGRSLATYIEVHDEGRSRGAHETLTQRAGPSLPSLRTAITMATPLGRSNTMRWMWAYSSPEQVRHQKSENLGELESRTDLLSPVYWPRVEEDTGSLAAL